MNCNIVNPPPPLDLFWNRDRLVKVINLDSTTILISIDNEYYWIFHGSLLGGFIEGVYVQLIDNGEIGYSICSIN